MLTWQVGYNGVIGPVRQRRVWRARLRNAHDYEEYAAAAAELDRYAGDSLGPTA